MLTITAVSAGSVEYLLRGSGCAEHRHADQSATPAAGSSASADAPESGAGYLLKAAELEPAGVWFGEGLSMVGIAAGTEATASDVRAVFGQLRHPSSTEDEPQFLGRPPRKFRSAEERIAAALKAEPDASEERVRQISNSIRADGRKPVAYYDLTFSPVKSVSVYYAALVAAGREAEAENVLRAHREAIAEAMAYVEEHVGFTRVGYHGRRSGRSVGEYARGTGLVWVRFDHRTNRAQEPQVHSHVAVLNRVITAHDLVIRALDGKGFRPVKMGVDALYRRGLERRMEEWFGVAFALRPDGKAREIVGVDQQLMAEASSRGAQVEALRRQAESEFRQQYGREPSPAQRKEIWNRAKLQDRPTKSGEASPRQQLLDWCAPRVRALTGLLTDTLDRARHFAEHGHPDRADGPERTRDQVLQAAVDAAQAQYATWTIGNLQDEIEKQVVRIPTMQESVPDLVAEVLNNPGRFGFETVSAPDPAPVPPQLQRPDGKLRFRPLHDELYATRAQLQTELAIVERVLGIGAPAISGPGVELARVELVAAGLSGDQLEAALGIATSGRTGDVLVGPAGTGKSRTIAGLAAIWETHLHGRVVGLATSENAALVLAEEGVEAMNTTVFLQRFTPDGQGVAAEQVRPGDLFVVDEAGMSSTAELDAVSRLVAAGGGKLLFTGDPRQLDAIGAGGLLELLIADTGTAYVLVEPHRFQNRWERRASVLLRAADVSALDLYERHGRLYGGTSDEVVAAAVRAYLADVLDGRSALLVVRSNEQATELAGMVRADLVRLGRVDAEVLATLRDGNLIGVGDLVQARRNDRRIAVNGPARVTNRAVYTVLGRTADGEVQVRDRNGYVADLPARYVARHLTLAYASTVHAAQGRTVDAAHALIDTAGASLRWLYVALTRGRNSNTAYVQTQHEPDHHDVERVDTTPRAALEAILRRPEEPGTSAEMTRRAGITEARSLGVVGTQWDLLATTDSQYRAQTALDRVLEPEQLVTLVAEPGFDRLLRAVRAMELGGHDVDAVVGDCVAMHHLDDADSLSNVLHWRITQQMQQRTPEREVTPGDWVTLTTTRQGPVGDYLRRLGDVAGQRMTEIALAAADDPPAWAVQHLGEAPEAGADRAEWIRRVGIVAAYRELADIPADAVSLGAAPSPEMVFHRALWMQAYAALGAPTDALDYAMAADAELREMRQQWRREATFAPYYVVDELRETYQATQGYQQDAVLWRAELQQLPVESLERGWAEAELAGAERMAAEGAARIELLEEIASARADWVEATADVRTRFELAGAELARRGLHRDHPHGEAGVQEELFTIAETRAPVRGHHQAPADDVALGVTVPDEELAAAAAAAAQSGLFELDATARDSAAAGPLRPDTPTPAPATESIPGATDAATGAATGAAPGSSTGEDATAVPSTTVGEALRQARISLALRGASSVRPDDAALLDEQDRYRDEQARRAATAQHSDTAHRDHAEQAAQTERDAHDAGLDA